MKGYLSPDNLRALRIISERNAHELVSRPLSSLGPLLSLGFLVVVREYETPSHGKAREIGITQKGRERLRGGRP